MANRFVTMDTESEGIFGLQTKVVIDTQTGVQYLYIMVGYGAGLTVLVGPDGKPLLTSPSAHNYTGPEL